MEQIKLWICTILDTTVLDINVVKELFQVDDFNEALTEREIIIALLYFIVTRRLFENKTFNRKDILFVKMIKYDIEHLLKTVTLEHDWIETFQLI